MKTIALLALAAANLLANRPLAHAHHHRLTPSPRLLLRRWRGTRPARWSLAWSLLLGALLGLAAAPAWAANCLRPPRDVGDNLEFFGIYAAIDTYSDNYCNKSSDAGWLSIQQMLDNLPRFSGPEDGTGTNLWNGPLTNYMAYALSHHGLCTETQYPLRQVRLVTAKLGDGPAPEADTDTYQFPGTNGAALTFELTPDSAQFGHTVTRPGDAILTLLAPDGTSVVKRARSLLPVGFTATLPAAGTYSVCVSQRAGSARSFQGDYRLLIRQAAGVLPGAVTNLADVETCRLRTAIDSVLNGPPQNVMSVLTGKPTKLFQCPTSIGGAGLISGMKLGSATFLLNVGLNGVVHPDFRNYIAGTLSLPDADATVQIWCKAIGYKGNPPVITYMVPDGIWPPELGGIGILASSNSTILPGQVIYGFGTFTP